MYKKYGLIGIIIVLFISVLIVSYKNDLKALENDSEEIVEEVVEVKKEVETIKVDIKGQVKKPGVYKLNVNSRVIDAIKKSGGLKSQADTSMINLSKKLEDEMVIIIYSKKQIKQSSNKEKPLECVCPDTLNDACVTNPVTNEPKKTEEIKPTDNEVTDSKVSLNSATLQQLQTLTGIGKSKAEAIIEYRNQNGGFKSIDEITKVSGIGTSTYEKIKDRLTL